MTGATDQAEAETQHGDSSASQLDSSLTQQLPDLTRLPGPPYASVGDYMQFTCDSVRVQSEMIQRLEDAVKRQNVLIHRLMDRVNTVTSPQSLPEGWELAHPVHSLPQPSAAPVP